MTTVKQQKEQWEQLPLFTVLHTMTIDPAVESLVAQYGERIAEKTSKNHYGAFHPDLVFSRLTDTTESGQGGKYQRWELQGIPAVVTPKRLRTFRSNMCCVSCGLEANIFLVEKHRNDLQQQYINLYHLGERGLVMFSVDHILPDSLGGRYSVSNFQTMCQPCNAKKMNHMSMAEIDRVKSNPEDHLNVHFRSTPKRDYIFALMDVQAAMNQTTDKKAAIRLQSLLDQTRKKVRANTTEQQALTTAAHIREEIQYALDPSKRPAPTLVLPAPVVNTGKKAKKAKKQVKKSFVRPIMHRVTNFFSLVTRLFKRGPLTS
jgi:hypothetical protein